MVDGQSDGQHYQVGFDYAWKWFALHANQRMQMVNFWLVAVAFFTAALVNAITDEAYAIAAVVSAAAAMTTLAFHRMDRRTQLLLKISERALLFYEANLASVVGTEDIRLVLAAEKDKAGLSSYRVVLGSLQVAVSLAYGVSFVCSLAWLVFG